jgi:argininosuccinate synthase
LNAKKVALAYSGGLDTSVIIPWLRETYGCRVVAVVVNVGQLDDFAAIERKALASGASECRIVDVRDEFIRDYAFPALRAGAIYEGRYLLGTALARPLIARVQVEVAKETGCDALAHGCTGKGNDQVRFELTYRALAPDLPVIAPWREWTLKSREDEIAYAAKHGIPVPVTAAKPYSIDQNLWHTSYEGGILEDPANPPPDEMFQLTVDPADAPDEPAFVEIGFERGIPVALNGTRLDPAELVSSLNALAGSHGVGRMDLVENRLVGMKSRGVYETPAGTVLRAALSDLESLTLDRETHHFRETISPRYAELVYYGLWDSPLRGALDAFLEASHRWVTGAVRVKLFKGSCLAIARSSPYSLYRHDLATFGEDGVYDQKDAGGFNNLWALPTRVVAAVRRETEAAVRRETEAAVRRETEADEAGSPARLSLASE